MFFLLATLSMIGYATQSVLLTKYARKMDGLSLAVYRNTSFIVTLSPLLLLTTPEEIAQITNFLPELIFMGLMGTFKLWTVYIALRYLPLGIVSSLHRSVFTVTMLIFGWLFFNETFDLLEINDLMQLISIFVIIAGTTGLVFIKNHMPHLDNKVWKGIFFTLIPTIPSAYSFYLLAKVSRELDPMVSAYFWELSIGIFALLVLAVRHLLTRYKVHKVSKKQYLRIALASLPTLLGTGALSVALTLGPIGVASAIGSASIIVATLMAHYLYHEKLKFAQWAAIIVVFIGLVGLRIFG